MATNGRDIRRHSIPFNRLDQGELIEALRAMLPGILPGLDLTGTGQGGIPVVWRRRTLAVGPNQTAQLVISQPIPVRPLVEPRITYILDQDVGTKADSFYWSGDGGLTATPPVEGQDGPQFIPNAGDHLYVNTSVLGYEVAAGDQLTIEYCHTPSSGGSSAPPAATLKSLLWHARTRAVAAGQRGQLAVEAAFPLTPSGEPLIHYVQVQDVGTLDNSFYWSADGGRTARPPVEGPGGPQFIPQAGDHLYVNTSVLGSELQVNDPLIAHYFIATAAT